MKILTERQFEKYGFNGYSGTTCREIDQEGIHLYSSIGYARTNIPLPGTNTVVSISLDIMDLHYKFYIVDFKQMELNNLTDKKMINMLLSKIHVTPTFIKCLLRSGRKEGRNEVREGLKSLLEKEL